MSAKKTNNEKRDQAKKDQNTGRNGRNGSKGGHKSGKPNGQRIYGRGGGSSSNSGGSDSRPGTEHQPTTKYGLNDFEWYNHYPELLESTAKVAFPFRPGMKVNSPVKVIDRTATAPGSSTQMATPSIEGTDNTLYFPGVMSIDFAPTVGQSENSTDPASIAAKEIYAKVRNAFSGAISIDPPDFVIHILAMDSIYSYLAWLKRVYRILNSINPNNYMVPYGMLAAIGINQAAANNLLENKANFLYYINQLVYMSYKYECPAIDLFKRHYWMNDNVYKDDDIEGAQYYLYNQTYYYRFKLLNPEGIDSGDTVLAGGLEMIPAPVVTGSTANVALSLYEYGRDLLDTLAGAEDTYTINGYLMRAFEGTLKFRVNTLLDDEYINPIWEPEVLMQIENTVTAPFFSKLRPGVKNLSNNVVQNVKTNTIVCRPQITTALAQEADNSGSGVGAGALAYFDKQVYNIRDMNPNIVQVVEASRMKPVFTIADQDDWDATTTTVTFDITCGTEIPLQFNLVIGDMAGEDYNVVPMSTTIVADMSAAPYFGPSADPIRVSEGGWTWWQLYLTQFDWHPTLIFLTRHSLSGSTNAVDWRTVLLGDTKNMTITDSSVTKEIHRVCILSEFNAFSM